MTKTLVLCFDGTMENFGPRPFSNVLKLYRMLENTDEQICYYQPGIGTSKGFDTVDNFTRFFSWSNVKNLLDATLAFTLEEHIVKGYIFLMKHYRCGDKIIMFGFSRGAFIARVITGMLERVGLLHNGLEDMIPMTWEIYRSWELAEQPSQPTYTNSLIEEFKLAFCRDYNINIQFQGLFDTVNSVGLFYDKMFPCTQRSQIVEHIRHALAIDERRGKFKQFGFLPNPNKSSWLNIQSENGAIEGTDLEREPLLSKQRFPGGFEAFNNNDDHNNLFNGCNELNQGNSNQQLSKENVDLLNNITKYMNENKNPGKSVNGNFNSSSSGSPTSTLSSDLVEKWFPGDHTDIGGGWTNGNCPDPDCIDAMSNLSLRWILGESIKFGCKFKKNSIRQFAERHSSMGSLFSCIHDVLSFSDNQIHLNNETLNKKWENLKKTSSQIKLNQEEPIVEKYRLNCQKTSRWVSIFWWILETLPLPIRIEDENNHWHNVYIPNFGKRREIPEFSDLHWSVYWLYKFNDQYNPTNLPLYAQDLIKQRIVERETDWKIRQMKECVSSKSNEISAILKIQKNDQEKAIRERISETNKLFDQWESDNWATVPDDLQDYITHLVPDIDEIHGVFPVNNELYH